MTRWSRHLLVGCLLAWASTAPPAAAHPPGSAVEYRWVAPPSWAAGARPPAQGREVEVDPALLSAGVADVWTPDAQAVVTITATAPVPSPASVTLTPLDPAALPTFDLGGVPNGNAYRIAVTTSGWEPTGVAVTLAPPFPASGMVALVDGTWSEVDVELVAGQPRAEVSPGVVVLALAAATDGHDSWWDRLTHDPVRVAVLGVGLIAIAAGLVRLLRRQPPGLPAAELPDHDRTRRVR